MNHLHSDFTTTTNSEPPYVRDRHGNACYHACTEHERVHGWISREKEAAQRDLIWEMNRAETEEAYSRMAIVVWGLLSVLAVLSFCAVGAWAIVHVGGWVK